MQTPVSEFGEAIAKLNWCVVALLVIGASFAAYVYFDYKSKVDSTAAIRAIISECVRAPVPGANRGRVGEPGS